MNRRSFLALALAPFLAPVLPKPLTWEQQIAKVFDVSLDVLRTPGTFTLTQALLEDSCYSLNKFYAKQAVWRMTEETARRLEAL